MKKYKVKTTLLHGYDYDLTIDNEEVEWLMMEEGAPSQWFEEVPMKQLHFEKLKEASEKGERIIIKDQEYLIQEASMGGFNNDITLTLRSV